MAAVILMAAIAVVLFAYIAGSVKMVRPYQRGVVERLGKFRGVVEPGLRIVVPGIDRVSRVDMREQVIDVPPQEVITSDNVIVSVDAVIYYEAVDPQRLVYNVGDFILAVVKLAQTNLRNVVGDMQLDDALTSRDKINLALRDILDDATDKWGVRVVRVEIQRVDPPPDVMDAMHEVMKAERTRRAVVTEAQGNREAAITRAEGEKQAAILAADGQAAATRAMADAESYRQLTVAAGEAAALQQVLTSIKEVGVTPEVLALKWFEALQVMSDGAATKIYLPGTPDGAASAIANISELMKGPESA